MRWPVRVRLIRRFFGSAGAEGAGVARRRGPRHRRRRRRCPPPGHAGRGHRHHHRRRALSGGCRAPVDRPSRAGGQPQRRRRDGRGSGLGAAVVDDAAGRRVPGCVPSPRASGDWRASTASRSSAATPPAARWWSRCRCSVSCRPAVVCGAPAAAGRPDLRLRHAGRCRRPRARDGRRGGGDLDEAWLRDRFYPTPRVASASSCAARDACIDVPTGSRRSAAGGGRRRLRRGGRRGEAAAVAGAAAGWARTRRERALAGGDDYELCFTVPASRVAEAEARLPPCRRPSLHPDVLGGSDVRLQRGGSA